MIENHAEKKFLELVEGLFEAAQSVAYAYTSGGTVDDMDKAAVAANAAREAVHTEHKKLLDAIRHLKVRIVFMDWPGESMWNAGSEQAPSWVPDWRYECHLIDHVLHGSEITVPEKPTDTKSRIEVMANRRGTPTWFVANLPGYPGGVDFPSLPRAMAALDDAKSLDNVTLSYWLHQADRVDYTHDQTLDMFSRYMQDRQEQYP